MVDCLHQTRYEAVSANDCSPQEADSATQADWGRSSECTFEHVISTHNKSSFVTDCKVQNRHPSADEGLT